MSMFDTTMRNLRRMRGDMRYAKPRSGGALVFLPACGVWSTAEKTADPVRALPLLFVAVARKPPATQVKADHVGRRTGAATDTVEFADRSFQ